MDKNPLNYWPSSSNYGSGKILWESVDHIPYAGAGGAGGSCSDYGRQLEEKPLPAGVGGCSIGVGLVNDDSDWFVKNVVYHKKLRKKKKDLTVWSILGVLFLIGFVIGFLCGSNFNAKVVPAEAQEPSKAVIESAPIIEESYSTPLIYDFTEGEIYLLAQLLCGEAGIDGDGEYDFETQIAKGDINWAEVNKVLDVVMNRVLSPGMYADNVSDVVLQSGAFSVMPENAKKTPSPEVVASVQYWADSFNSPEYVPSIPDDHFWFSGSRGCNITRDHF